MTTTIKKTAWQWSDLTGELGLFALTDVGIMGILGAAGVFSGGATGLAGAGAAIAGGPVGWALLAGGLAYAIYEGTRMADETIAGLLERISALDYEGTEAESEINQWTLDLNGIRKSLSDEENIAAKLQNAALINYTYEYLTKMRKDWPSVKNKMGGWWEKTFESDREQFSNTLDTTISKFYSLVNLINRKSQEDGTKMMQQKKPTFAQVLSKRASPNALIDSLLDLDAETLFRGKGGAFDTVAQDGAWHTKLKDMATRFRSPGISKDPTQNLQNFRVKKQELENDLHYLTNTIQSQWSMIRSQLGDWFGDWGDAGDFEKQLAKTIQDYQKMITYLDQNIQKFSPGAQQQETSALIPQASKVKAILMEIRMLYSKISKAHAKPEFSPEEKEALMAVKYLPELDEGDFTSDDPEMKEWAINTAKAAVANVTVLVKIRDQLSYYWDLVQKKKSSSNKPALSKRAVNVPGYPAPGGTARGPSRGPSRGRSNPQVRQMQQQMNDYASRKNIPGVNVNEDGDYGKETANALVTLMNAVPKLREALSKEAVTVEFAANPKLMNSRPRYLGRAAAMINRLYQGPAKSQQKTKQESEKSIWDRVRGRVNQPVLEPEACNPSEANPTDGQILGCLMNKVVNLSGGGRESLYNLMARKQMNHKMMVRYVKNMNKNQSLKPSDWDDDALAKGLGGRYTILTGR